jgi:hypothetical protein
MFAELSEDILSPAARDTGDDVGGASGGGKPEGNPTLEPDLIGRPTTALLLVGAVVAGTGFEPVKAMPAILQTAPFGRSGTLPGRGRMIPASAWGQQPAWGQASSSNQTT